MAERCVGCHTNGGQSGGLNFDNFLVDTVNVLARLWIELLEPGRRHASYLWHKVREPSYRGWPRAANADGRSILLRYGSRAAWSVDRSV